VTLLAGSLKLLAPQKERALAEIIPRVTPGGMIDFVDEKERPIPGAAPISPMDAALMARELLCTAAQIHAAPGKGTALKLVADKPLTITRVADGRVRLIETPVLLLTIAPGLTLTFLAPPETIAELRMALDRLSGMTAPSSPPEKRN